MSIDLREIETELEQQWRDSVVPCLEEYIRIPNKSPLFAPDWEREGHMQRAVDLLFAD